MFGIDSVMKGIGALFEAVMKFFAALIDTVRKYPKTTATIVLITILSFGGWRLKVHIDELNNQIVTVTEERNHLKQFNEELKESLLTALEANKENQETLDKLTKDKEALNRIIRNLRNSGKTTNEQLEELKKRLQQMGEEDNGPLAKVLREAIRSIEENRKEREKLWK